MLGKVWVPLAIWMLSVVPAKTAEIQISTENTVAHFQTVFLQNYAKALNEAIPEHHFTVIHTAKAFSDREVAAAVSSARVAIAAPGIWHLGQYSSDLDALLLPYFMGLEAQTVRTLVDGKVGQALSSSLERHLNIKVFGKWLDVGPAYIFTRDKAINRFSDLKGLRIRYAGGTANALRLAALGATPVLIPWPNVSEALENSEIDGILSTSSAVVSAALWEHGIKYAFRSNSYYPFYVPVISRDIWKRLSDDQRDIIADTWNEMISEGRALAVAHDEMSINKLRTNGTSITTPSTEDLDTVRRALRTHQHEIAQQVGISENMLGILAQYGGN